jgi:hypothetical protein
VFDRVGRSTRAHLVATDRGHVQAHPPVRVAGCHDRLHTVRSVWVDQLGCRQELARVPSLSIGLRSRRSSIAFMHDLLLVLGSRFQGLVASQSPLLGLVISRWSDSMGMTGTPTTRTYWHLEARMRGGCFGG